MLRSTSGFDAGRLMCLAAERTRDRLDVSEPLHATRIYPRALRVQRAESNRVMRRTPPPAGTRSRSAWNDVRNDVNRRLIASSNEKNNIDRGELDIEEGKSVGAAWVISGNPS
jgi:hypothetical protein